jgi:hypothetical protein
MLLELGWRSSTRLPVDPICLLFLLSYVALGLVVLELGWAGVGISWLVLFKSHTHTAPFPILICCSPRTDAAGAGLGGRRNLLDGSLLPAHPIYLPFLLSYVVLGLVLLELGWAGIGIS